MADNREEIELGLQEAIIDAIETGFDKAEVMDTVHAFSTNGTLKFHFDR